MSTSSATPRAVRKEQARLGVLMCLPLLVVMGVFVLFPMLNAVYYVFVDFNGLDPSPPWVGLANITESFTDPDVWAAARNNVIWIVIGTDRKSTRLNSSHANISYAVFCLNKHLARGHS